MSRWLVRFGYDGAGFGGWARQPGLRTVEGTLREGLPRTRVAPTADAARLAVASRTDRGVSARSNALTVSSDLPPTAVLRALNGVAPDIFFTAISAVPDDFSARGADSRWYRYFEPAQGHSLARWKRAAASLRGEVDVRSFGRDVPSERPALRTVTSVEVLRSENRWLVVDLKAPAFVWGMVRKIIAAMRKVDDGSLSLGRFRGALRGEHRLTLPLAEPEGLVLWDVTYPVPWSRTWEGPNRAQSRYLTNMLRQAHLRETIGRRLPGASPPDEERRGQ